MQLNKRVLYKLVKLMDFLNYNFSYLINEATL